MPTVGVYLSEPSTDANDNETAGESPIAVIAKQQTVLQQQLKQMQEADLKFEDTVTKVFEQIVKKVDDQGSRLLAIETRLNLERKFKSSPPRSPR